METPLGARALQPGGLLPPEDVLLRAFHLFLIFLKWVKTEARGALWAF